MALGRKYLDPKYRDESSGEKRDVIDLANDQKEEEKEKGCC